jgi:hypothetical protein
MAAFRVGNLHFIGGRMNKHVYVNILREHLNASAEKLGIPKILHFTVTVTPKFFTFDKRVVLVQLPKSN